MMMTCQRMWEIGRQHLESLIESLLIYGSWAGHRLVCLGDYADLDDLPKDMMTPSEVKYIRDFLGEDEDDSYGCSMFDGIRALQQYNLQVSFTFLDPQSLLSVMKIKSGSQLWYELDWPMERSFLRSRNYKRLYLYLAFETLVQITSPPSPKSFYSGDIVLRNLTTKEYVRGDGITELWDTPEKPWLEEIRFEHALYMRTTWSSDGSLSLNYDGPIQIHRGIWAGNRFDVSGIKTVRDENGSSVDGWKDVTDDVLKEVVEVWENEGRWRY
ncbi:hypothetical protein DXG01_015629 [Tephrocybe rancida]|nr:hypothetical protein DXG01_015629 [Tephrocybe rancida]